MGALILEQLYSFTQRDLRRDLVLCEQVLKGIQFAGLRSTTYSYLLNDLLRLLCIRGMLHR
jgi:hypothetical protein